MVNGFEIIECMSVVFEDNKKEVFKKKK